MDETKEVTVPNEVPVVSKNTSAKVKGARNKPQEEQTKSRGGLVIFLSIFTALLLGASAFLGYTYLENEKTIGEKDKTITATTDSLDQTIRRLKDLQIELEEQKTLVSDKQNLVDSLDQAILRVNIEIKKYKSGYYGYQSKALKAEAKYNALLDSIKKLTASFQEERASFEARIQTVEKERNDLRDTISSFNSLKTELFEKVALASILRAENINVSAVSKKGKDVPAEKGVLKHKSIEKLKVTFNLAENKVAKKDKKDIMMRVVEPSGSVLFDNEHGGGLFQAEGKEIPYTASQSIQFDNSKQKVAFLYLKGGEYKPGNYTIELYAEGHRIGEGKFIVK